MESSSNLAWGCVPGFVRFFFVFGIVPLEMLKNGSICLSDILFAACTAGYAVYQIRASACEVSLTSTCLTCYGAGNFPTPIQVWTVSICFMFAGIFNEIWNFSNLIKGDGRVWCSLWCEIPHRTAVCDQAV